MSYIYNSSSLRKEGKNCSETAEHHENRTATIQTQATCTFTHTDHINAGFSCFDLESDKKLILEFIVFLRIICTVTCNSNSK